MKTLIKKAIIITPEGGTSSRKDILVENGVITQIAKSITDGKADVIESGNLHVSAGWLDIGAQCGQPGYEHRETFDSISQCALAGGYTALATFPRNNPAIQSRVEIEYIRKINLTLPIWIYPIGAISHDLEGKDLTEMIDMMQSGAVAFSDGRKNPVEAGLLMRALQYVAPFSKPIIQFPLDRSLTADGQMHEGKMSASLGLNGIPSIAEEIIVQRDIKLLGYAGGKLHFHAITTQQGVQHILKARHDGLQVSCDVPAFHLLLEDRDVGDFDNHKKILPPLREPRDRKSLIKAVRDGVVSHISSLHTPLEIEQRECEFTYAGFGSVGLEACFAAANTALREVMPLTEIVALFCEKPRQLLDIDVPKISVDQPASLTVFDPDIEWKYEGTKYSLSNNDAMTGRSLTGKVIATLSQNHVAIN